MKKISLIFSALMLCLTMTACGSGEHASAPSVAENDKAAVHSDLKLDNEYLEQTLDDLEQL